MATPYTMSDSLTGNSLWSRRVEYNSQGLVSDVSDARSIQAHWTYDGLNRVSEIPDIKFELQH